MKHEIYELRQMQAMPLDIKIRMTKERIEAWYENWTRFDIVNKKTGRKRFKTIDTRDRYKEPDLRENEYIDAAFDGQIYLCFSGGKDSTVLKHMVDSMYDDIPAVFVNTGLEYPEIQNFARKQKNVVVMRPEMNFRDVILTYGYPVISKEIAKNVRDGRSAIAKGREDARAVKKLTGRLEEKDGGKSKYNCENWRYLLDAPFKISDYCCNVMKKRPAHMYERETGRKPMTAIMADESMLRTARWLKTGCNAFDADRPNSAPMSFWTEQDVLHYLQKYEVTYCDKIYGGIRKKGVLDGQTNFEGFDGYDGEELETSWARRTGCIFCMFGCHLEDEPNRFQKLKETHPRQYEYCIGGGEFVDGMWQPSKDGLGLGFVLDYIGVKY